LIVPQLLRPRIEVIVDGSFHVGQRHVLAEHAQRHGIHPVCRDAVTGKLRANGLRVRRSGRSRRIEIGIGPRRQRIVDRRRAGEITDPPGFERHGHHHRLALRASQSLEAGEEERPLLRQRAAERAAVLVLGEMRELVGVVERPRVECAVTQMIVHAPAELLRARLGHDVDLPVAPGAELRGVAAGLDLKLADCIRRKVDDVGVERRVGVRRPVDAERVGAGPPAGDADGGVLTRAPVERQRCTRSRSVRRVHARNEQRELEELPAVQR
jgi:hypothetical protein